MLIRLAFAVSLVTTCVLSVEALKVGVAKVDG